jgi:hypothetical protein
VVAKCDHIMIEPFSAKGIAGRIHAIRRDRVMHDADLAALYGVPTRRLNEQVRRRRDYLPLAFTEHGCLMLSNVLNRKLAVHERAIHDYSAMDSPLNAEAQEIGLRPGSTNFNYGENLCICKDLHTDIGCAVHFLD